MAARRSLSLPYAVSAAGGMEEWNRATPEGAAIQRMVASMVAAESLEQTLADVRAILALGDRVRLWAYAYMRCLRDKSLDLFFATIRAMPDELIAVIYTPTVGEACQALGWLPMYARGCFLSVSQRGRLGDALEEYARAHLVLGEDGLYGCDCIVLTDGGRILGLGDLGAWGMGIPLGKLDLYTACGGIDPRRTIPMLLDAGVHDPAGNTAHIDVRHNLRYTGAPVERVTRLLADGSSSQLVNSAYHDGEDNVIAELLASCVRLFGRHVLVQFEDFNSADAFPILSAHRNDYLCFNDDVQGTAAAVVAGILGSLRLQNPCAPELVPLLREHTFLFHGAGSANLGTAILLVTIAGVPRERIYLTNSKGLVWTEPTAAGAPTTGGSGTARNDGQRAFARVGAPGWPCVELADIVRAVRPSFLIGATGVSPGCFDRTVVDTLVAVQAPDACATIFALSNPSSQAELTAEDAYGWTGGNVIFGSGTPFAPVTTRAAAAGSAPGDARARTVHSAPGEVNNMLIFPGLGLGAVHCAPTHLPDAVLLAAAAAVAASLTAEEVAEHRILPHKRRAREVSLNVAAAVALSCQELGVSTKTLGSTHAEIKAALEPRMWSPTLD